MTAQLEVSDPKERLAAAQARFGNLVAVSEPFPGQPPLWIEPTDTRLGADIAVAVRWMDDHHEGIEAAMLSFGAIVWRGFPVRDSEDFDALFKGFEAFSKGYAGGTSDRKGIKGRVMEATRTQPDIYILLHQEMSYLESTPRLVAFYCRNPSPVGGETIICDMRGLLSALPEPLRRKIEGKEIRYVRNMRTEALDDWRAEPAYRHPSWQYRFETGDAADVEAQLVERGAHVKWEADGSLTFWSQMPGTLRHPVTGELLFFNQVYSQGQHRICIGAERADLMDAAYGDSIPRPYSVAFGDGEPLSEDDFMAIHTELERRKVAFTWRPGDVMLVENKLTGHGRHPFAGPRDVQVMLLE